MFFYKKKKRKKPLISIITVVLNGEKYLEKTIKSVIGQNQRIQYIIIDGGSTDNSLNIIKPSITKNNINNTGLFEIKL